MFQKLLNQGLKGLDIKKKGENIRKIILLTILPLNEFKNRGLTRS